MMEPEAGNLTRIICSEAISLIARFNARVEERRRPRWERWRDWGTFPGSNGLHYNFDSRRCAIDFTQVLSHHQLSSDTATEDDFLKRYFFDDVAHRIAG
jgi:hypothetical protein